MMTLLELVQQFSLREGLPYPTAVASSAEKGHLLAMGLLNEELDDLVEVYNWTGTVREATFTSVAASDQGAIATHAPYGFIAMLNKTFFDRTDQRPMFGPLSATGWQVEQAMATSQTFYHYRIQRGHIYTEAAMPAGHTMAFEYSSNYAVEDVQAVPKRYFTADTDTPVIKDTILLRGLKWRWLRKQGLPYEEQEAQHIAMTRLAFAKDGTKPTLDMGDSCEGPKPGIVVPDGNWTP